MIYHTINPVLLDPGFVEIRYYGLFYIIGLVISYFILRHLAWQRKIGLSDEDVQDYIIWVAIGLLLGARIFYFIFYEPWLIWQRPSELIMIWHGGMSFHGGLIGAVVAAAIFSRLKKISFYRLADISVIPVALSLAIGRIGNLINGELYGRLWDGAFCIDYSQNPYLLNPPQGCRYPSQLVESAKNLFIFSALWVLKDLRFRGKKLPDGTLFWSFVFLYGLMRFFIEFIREPDAQLGFVIGWMTMGQVLCIFMIVIGAVMVGRRLYHAKPDPPKLKKN